VVYLGRFLRVGSGVDMPIGRGVLVPLANITILLVIANNIYKYIFI
jgi:hypothetical protein